MSKVRDILISAVCAAALVVTAHNYENKADAQVRANSSDAAIVRALNGIASSIDNLNRTLSKCK